MNWTAMRPISADELARMRMTQTDAMLDECVVMSYAEGARNEFNEADAPTYTDSNPIPCGLNTSPKFGISELERHGQDMTMIRYDAEIRLPINTEIKETDRIRIVSRFGLYPGELTYEITSPIQRGPSAIRLRLRKVTV